MGDNKRLLVAVLLIAAAASSASADWPTYRGNNNRDGYSGEKSYYSPSELGVLWNYTVGSLVYSSPSSADINNDGFLEMDRYLRQNYKNVYLGTLHGPPGWDKQSMREMGKMVRTTFVDRAAKKIVGINNLDPKNPLHIKFVHRLRVPREDIEITCELYHIITEKLTGMPSI